MSSTENTVVILDFGSQYTHLIARRIRELGVQSHILPSDTPAEALSHARGIILSGGPRSVVREPLLPFDKGLFDLEIPILGLCYGHQLMATHYGGTVAGGSSREYGVAALSTSQSTIFSSVPEKTTVWMSHGDHAETLPNGFSQIATTGNASIAAMADERRKRYGFQFHPEVTHSEHGMQMLQAFLFTICAAEKNWTTQDMLARIQEEIRSTAQDKHVFLLVSGGVDSTVCFALLEKTLGKDRVYGLHIDLGIMRKNESNDVSEALAQIGLDDLHVYNAAQECYEKLAGIVDPEEKRKRIGELYLDVAQRVMQEQGCDEETWLLGQGTIYPDVIESGGSQHADTIKTHHNRVDRVKDMIAKGLVIEPIKELYKDEVRDIGRALGLPEALVARRPFPGPGLAIRCLCSDGSEERPRELESNILELPIKSVGVQGDERTYAHPALCLAERNWDRLAVLAPRITNTYYGINRVLISLYGEKADILSSRMHANDIHKTRLDLLRELDIRVREYAEEDPNWHTIWQMPVVLVPFGFEKKETLVIRPFESKEVMTASFGKLSEETLSRIARDPFFHEHVDFIFYDITNKPPGTIEWE